MGSTSDISGPMRRSRYLEDSELESCSALPSEGKNTESQIEVDKAVITECRAKIEDRYQQNQAQELGQALLGLKQDQHALVIAKRQT